MQLIKGVPSMLVNKPRVLPVSVIEGFSFLSEPSVT